MISGLDAFGMDGTEWNNTVIINSNFSRIDDLNVREASKAEAEARRACFYVAEFLRKHVPGFKNAYIISTAPNLGVRFTRWIEGEYTLSSEEVKAGARFADVIGVASSGFPGKPFEIPYRCIVPKKVENLLVASGKSVSTNPRGLLRGMTTCIILGQAAGVAASLSSEGGTTPRRLDVKLLQKALFSQDVYLGNKNRLAQLDLV